MSWESKTRICSVPGCGRAFSSSFNGIEYCNKHYLRMKNNGTIEKIGKTPKTIYRLMGDVAIGETTKGDRFTVDADILNKVSKHTWCKDKRGYYVAVVNRIAPEDLGGNGIRIKIMRWLGGDWRYPHHIPAWINDEIHDAVTHWRPIPAPPRKENE